MTALPLAPPAHTLEQQRRASNPAASAWVSANAGSGKTHVLTRRVVRLLLDGTPPGRILCLTFTKAAAANMSIRVFKELAAWTRLADDALTRAIVATGAPAPVAADMGRARKLFARTVETPGGLKVQTIHAFCERLLHLFPFEANVPARFEVLDDARAADLLLRAREAAFAAAMADEGGDLAAAIGALEREAGEQTFEKLLNEALGHRPVLRSSMAAGGYSLEGLARMFAKALGLEGGETVERIERDIVEGGIEPPAWGDLARRIGADQGDMRKTGNRLATAATAPGPARCEAYLDVFLTREHEPRKDAYLPAGIRKALPDLCAELDRERDRVADLVGRRKAAATAARSAALIVAASAILERYDVAKRRRGLLDFDDLVERTATLLERSDAAWVLFKLDRGIDHILVDEAQDTSPAQWDILRAISADFFAGEGASRAKRTFFAVGDEKQSIYSFQGARSAEFANMRRHFGKLAEEADHDFAAVPLLLSFRSAKAILHAVDSVFAHPGNARGLTGDDAAPPPHEALKQMPGLVEIWPALKSAAADEPRDWRLPVDVVEPGDPAVVLARRIAAVVAGLTAPGSKDTVEDNDTRERRRVRPGDVLILVRSRGAFFEAMIRALKDRGLPVAGADRLALTDHIAVMDLIAAGRAALTPSDDFTLACVLKSPLIGLDDGDLIELAPKRTGTLFAALATSGTPAHRAALAKLEGWQDRAARLTPFAFYTRMLGADGGRRDLLGRLGPEAGDAIDEFVALTLAHERDGAPSLLAFLARLDGADLTIKRDLEAAGLAVRVMTVHAAKGLEAKVVFLPDTCGVPTGRHDPKLFPLEEAGGVAAHLAWSPKADADPAAVRAARENARRRAVEEHNRLLYVAMTRAEERLYVAGFCKEKGPPEGSWYAMIEAAGLELAPVAAPWDPSERVGRFADPPPDEETIEEPPLPAGDAPLLPEWIGRPPSATEADPDAPPVRPSNPLGAADQRAPVDWSFADRHRSTGRRDAMTAGRLMHKLLQFLPAVEADRRDVAATRFLAAQGATLDEERRAAMSRQALRVLADPALGALFGPESRAEVAIAASLVLPSGRTVEVTGQIDRIGVAAEAVFIADYKTGAPTPALTAKHLLQLALYAAAVAPLYPDRSVRAFLVWTRTAQTVEIEPGRLEAALRDME